MIQFIYILDNSQKVDGLNELSMFHVSLNA